MQQIRIDFDNPGLPQSLGAVEDESQSRIFQAALYKSGAAYTAPAGAVYSIMYRGFGPQNQGWYDTIEDGAGKRAACTVSGNVVTCELARQALRVPGHLTVVLCVSDAKGYMLKSWPIMADVRNDGYEDTGEIEMYFNLSGLAGNYLTQLEKAMADAETTRNNLTSTSAQVKKDIDAKAAETLKTIPESYTELDGSVKRLKKDIVNSALNKYTLNTDFVDGKYIDSAGALIDCDGWRTSNFIAISKNICLLSFENTNIQYNYNNAFYDENYQFVGAFIANKLVRVPKKAKYIRCSFENDAFNKAYFTSSTYRDYLALLCNTIRVQSKIEIVERNNDFSYNVVFEPFKSANLGYYKEPYNSSETYITVGTSENAVNGKYTINIPLHSALVIDVTKFASNTTRSVEIKDYNNITENDLILFSNNCSSQAKQYQKGGLLFNAYFSVQKENNDSIMKSVCRFGLTYGQPESADSVVKAKKAGYNYYRCNLQCTKDGIFVLWHDQTLNQYYKNVYDGNSLVPYSETNKIVISEKNISELNKYKYGSTDYNTGIPTLEKLLKSCRINNMKLYIESKMTFTSEQIAGLYSLISRYGMTAKTSIVLSKSNAEMLAKIDKSIRVGVDYAEFSTDTKNVFIELTGLFDNVFWWGWTTMTLTKDTVDFLSKHNIEFECGDFGSSEAIDTYLSTDYAWYCSGMELEGSMSPLISDYLKNS